MEGPLALSRAIDRLNEFVGKWVSWLILVSILVSSTNAVVRKAFNISSNAWLELQWYLFGAAFLLAAAYTLKQNEHIRIDIVYGMWPRRVQHWIDLIGHIFFLMPFCLLMVYYLVPYVTRSVRSGEMSTNAGGLIIWPAKAMLLAGFFLLALQGISEIIKKIAVMRGHMDDPNPFVSSHEQAEIEAKTLAGEGRP
ncbi:TRAP-type mannitol/chloroaromatic compound transport system permease small subunit [Aquamicrobium terrae]